MSEIRDGSFANVLCFVYFVRFESFAADPLNFRADLCPLLLQ
jgi:hypothetical protein